MDEQHIHDHVSGRKYFHTLLNMVDEDLNPYQYRLYGHYVRVAGETGACYESVRTTARITQMSAAMVIKTRNELTELRFIECVKSDEQNDTIAVTLVDRWAENIARYSEKRSPHEQGVHHINTSQQGGVHHINTGVHQESHKKNYKKKNDSEEKKSSASTSSGRQRNPLFDGVATELFAAKLDDAAAIKRIAGRVGKLAAFLKERDVQPEAVTRFVKWYREKYENVSLPLDEAKFVTHWTAFEAVSVSPATQHSNGTSKRKAYYQHAWIAPERLSPDGTLDGVQRPVWTLAEITVTGEYGGVTLAAGEKVYSDGTLPLAWQGLE